jgi:hypothetical protein
LASLNSARNKSADAAIKANLASIRPQAELYYANYDSYGVTVSSCGDLVTASAPPVLASVILAVAGGGGESGDHTIFADPNVVKAIIASVQAGGGSASCRGSANAWAVSVTLKSTGYWCVDSTGVSKARASQIITTAC